VSVGSRFQSSAIVIGAFSAFVTVAVVLMLSGVRVVVQVIVAGRDLPGLRRTNR
jgi:hypothetical protein